MGEAEVWAMPKRVSASTAQKRAGEVMSLQAEIDAEILAGLKGTEDTVLLTAPPARKGGRWIGLSTRQAPDDIDGATLVSRVPADAAVGSFIRVRYTGASDYNLLATAR